MLELNTTRDQTTHAPPPEDLSVVDIRGLWKYYDTAQGPYPALRGIDLQVQRGDFLAIVGKSGAGKSTLVNMLTGIDKPDEGEIYIDGVAVHTLNEDQRSRWRGKNLGVVFQFFQLLPNLTLVENITIAMDFTNSLPLRKRRDRAMELLDRVGIAEHAHKEPSRISGGQQQRVAIARALANDPPVILADEPTGNLDSKTAADIFDLFEGLVAQGKTLIMVTHDRGISKRAGRLIELADGEIIE